MIHQPRVRRNLVASHRDHRHRFSAARDDHLRAAATNPLRGQRNRLQTRRAEAIDGERRDLNRQSRAQRGDASDVHPLLGLGHSAAKDDIVYFFRIDLRYALQSALDGDSTEFIRTRRPQHAFESTSHRCAHRRNENDFTHKNS